MDVINSTNSGDSSVVSSTYNAAEDEKTVATKNFAKELLKSRIFLGRYIERRLVDKRIGYRDIVVVSAAEVELKKDLIDVQHKLHSLNKFHWIGITDTDSLNYKPSGLCLWIEMENQPFGPFWFQIKTIQFRSEEAIIKLKCLRHISDAFLEAEPILTGSVRVKESTKTSSETLNVESLSETIREIKGNLYNAFTFTNIKEFITFTFALVIAIFTGSTAFVHFLGNFVLSLVREFSILVHNSTPLFLGTLDVFSKIVGGFYILMAMIFKPNAPAAPNRRSVQYYNEPQQKNFDSRFID